MSEEGPAPVDAGQAAQAPVAETWTSGFDDTLKGYIENKGFKDAAALATSYQNLEKLRGVPAEQLLQFPKDMTNREEMLPVYAKMGMPDTAEAYTRALPETFDEGAYKALAEKAHQLGLGDGQFQGLQEMFAEQASALIEQQESETIAAFDEWKSANPDGFNNAARVMAEIGMNEEQVAGVLSGDKTSLYDMLAKVGARTAESTVVHGEQPGAKGFKMSATAAQTKINELMADETFTKQLYSDNPKVRAPAIARMEELHKIVSP